MWVVLEVEEGVEVEVNFDQIYMASSTTDVYQFEA
jgi:hypothetical protein